MDAVEGSESWLPDTSFSGMRLSSADGVAMPRFAHLIPEGMREFSFYEFDLDLDRSYRPSGSRGTPSLMAPFQVFFVRGVKSLYGRGKHTPSSRPLRNTSSIRTQTH